MCDTILHRCTGLNTKKMNTRLVITLSAIVFFCLLIVKTCNTAAVNKHLQSELTTAQNTIGAFKSELTKKDQQIATQDMYIGSEKNARAILQSDYNELSKKYKRIAGAVKVEANAIIKEVLVPYEKTVLVPCDSNTACVPVGTKAYIEQPEYTLAGKVDSLGFKVDSLQINTDAAIVYGKPKDKLLKAIFAPSSPTVSVMFKNKYIRVNRIENASLPPKKAGKYIGIGAGIGAVVVTSLLLILK